tara:strand:+ start:568 stop:669 length:102 start_codon:yes stop_codon:yes gene_type:complete
MISERYHEEQEEEEEMTPLVQPTGEIVKLKVEF